MLIKKNLLFACCVLLAGLCTAQTDPLNYYRLANKAELAICRQDFAKASELYTAAFKLNPNKPFSRDLMNAFFCAMDTKQYQLAEPYIAKLLSRGLGDKYIFEKILSSYKDEQLKIIQSYLLKYKNDTSRRDTLHEKIRTMMVWDQGVRNYFGKMYDGRYMVDSTFNVDYTNAKELLKLFLNYGVPNQDMLGNGGQGDYEPTASPDYDVLIMHHNGGIFGNKPAHFFDTFIYKAVFTWDYDPRWLSLTLEGTSKSKPFQYGNVVIHFPYTISGAYLDDLIYPEYWPPEIENRMNEDRAKLGLESVDEMRTKIEAGNAGKKSVPVLSKYHFGVHMMLLDLESDGDLKAWKEQNQKYKKG
jgi:tetratricopeptide (TPR) repeat protein